MKSNKIKILTLKLRGKHDPQHYTLQEIEKREADDVAVETYYYGRPQDAVRSIRSTHICIYL